jgi:hypothetical protein
MGGGDPALTRLGTVSKEYGIREDQMHQSENDILFYHLCLADPGAHRQERARRFAGFYLYNGGLLHIRRRYFDEQRKRPGLPEMWVHWWRG